MAGAERGERVGAERRGCDLVVSGAVVLTLDDEDTRIGDGAVAVAAGAILAVGTRTDIDAAFAPARRIDVPDGIVLPGFVNVHNHTPLVLVRGVIEDVGVAASYTTAVPPMHALSDEEAFLLARLGLHELLRFGSTTVVDSFHLADPLGRALEQSGLRGVVGGRVMDVDSDALARGEALRFSRGRGQARLEAALAAADRWHGAAGGRIRAHLQPHATNTCSPELLAACREAAVERGLALHIHVAQSREERDTVRATHGRSPMELLDDLGLLQPGLVAAHCLFVDDSDIARLGRSGAALAHAPLSNARAGLLPRVLDFERAGAVVAIGGDGASADMLECLRVAASLARIGGADFEPKAAQTLRWAIRGGARALGLDREVGRLRPGFKADIVVVGADGPNLGSLVDPVGSLVWAGHGGDVHTVIVDGQILLHDRAPTRRDAPEVLRAAREVIARAWRRHGAPAAARERVA